MKYFVTGATCFVGGVLVKRLREAGHEVNASIRSPENANEVQALGVKLFKGDVTDKESMREAMAGVDGVFHVAGWYRVGTRKSRMHRSRQGLTVGRGSSSAIDGKTLIPSLPTSF